MPELPEVETMVRGIRGDCTGREILSLEIIRSRRNPVSLVPNRSVLQRRSRGQTIQQVSRLAKRVVIELQSGDCLVIEPRMTGLMLISDPPTREHRRLVWHLHPKRGLARSLEFWDRRGLGTVSVFGPQEMAALRARLGPDALEMTLDEWQQRLSRTSRPVKVALLDQQLVAGIGNLYASEILHVAGLSPLKTASDLKERDILNLAEASRQVLYEAIYYEGSTLQDGTYRNALNQTGGYQSHHRVYQRADQPCRSCGKTNIVRIIQAQRSTFYCPRCQKPGRNLRTM